MFEYERGVFSRLKAGFTAYEEDLRKGLRILIENYNTTIYENRFVVGGAVEYFIGILLNHLKIPAEIIGDESVSSDIRLANGKGISVKSSFTKKTNEIRLINTMGESEDAKWATPTIFVIANQGIGYADHDLIDKEYLERQKDCLTLKTKGLYDFWNDNEKFFIKTEIPEKPTKPATKSKKASEEVAKNIIKENGLFAK